MRDGYVIRGLELRYVLTLLLLDAGVLTVDDLVRLLRASGFAVDGRASKSVSDALRWEIGRGRVVRFGRGRYAAGWMPRQTKSRMRARVAMVEQRRATAAGADAWRAASAASGLSLRGGTAARPG